MGAKLGYRQRIASSQVQVTWTPPSQTDLAEIRAYISEADPHAANKMIVRVVFAGNALEELPNRGRPTALADVRELVVSDTPYLLVYRVHQDIVQILRVWHGAQDRG